MKPTLLLIFLTLLAACQTKQANTITISVSKNTVVVKGIPATSIYGLKNDSLSLPAWQSLFPVCAMPADTDYRNLQEPMKGRYAIMNNDLTFTPDTAFKTGATYFARYYNYDNPVTSTDMALNKRKPGDKDYIELVFKGLPF